MTTKPLSRRPQARRRFAPIVIDMVKGEVVLSQGEESIRFSCNVLPLFLGSLVCLMRDTGAPPNIYRRMLAEIEAAVPPETVPAIWAVDLPVITEH